MGGKLYLTTQRLLFVPHFLDRLLAGRAWSASLSDIADVGTSPRGEFKTGPFSGSIRERLKVELRDGGVNLFVIKPPDEAAHRVRAALPG